MESIWPEEEAKNTNFYFCRNGTENEDPYHLTFISDHASKSSNDNGDKQKQKRKEKLVLYHAKTREFVDSMNVDDIIGVELEIKFEDDPNSSSNLNANAGGIRAISSKDFNVGVNNAKARERSDNMERYEKQLGKKLIIAGNMDEFQCDEDYDSYDEDEKNKPRDKCTSAAYLNIFCYPRRLPRPPIATLVKNCYNKNSSTKLKSQQVQSFEQILQHDDEDDDIDESQMGHRYEKHRRYKLFPTENFSAAQSLIPAIRKIARLGHFEEEQQQIINSDTNSSSTNDIKSTIIDKRKHFLEMSHKDSKTNLTTCMSSQRKKFLVIVNPCSGTKHGKKVYETIVRKMLQECGVDHDVLMTQHSGHAFNRMKKDDTHDSDDVSTYNAIISVGGDGILSEIMNGLRSRDDFDTIMKQLKFGIVGCGTGNGLAASLLHKANVSISWGYV